MMPIAEYTPAFSGGELAVFLGILFFLLATVIAWRKVFGNDPPLHKEYVTNAAHLKLEQDTKAAHAKLEQETRAALAEQERQARVSRKVIYDKIEAQGQMLSSNSQKTDLTYAQLQNLDGKMDRLLERVPRQRV